MDIRLRVPKTGDPHGEVQVFYNVSQVSHSLAGPNVATSIDVDDYFVHIFQILPGCRFVSLRAGPFNAGALQMRQWSVVSPLTVEFTFNSVAWLWNNSERRG